MRYVLGVIVIVAIALFAIFSITSKPPSTNSPKVKQALKLPDYADKNSKITLTNQGKIVGEDQFKSIRINVSRDDRAIEILQGYEGNVERNEHFSNTFAAYDNFLRALNTANFIGTRTSSIKDERGICPLGNRYIYDLVSNNNTVMHSWSDSCGDAGTFAGKSTLVRQLFQNQITDYNKFVVGVQL